MSETDARRLRDEQEFMPSSVTSKSQIFRIDRYKLVAGTYTAGVGAPSRAGANLHLWGTPAKGSTSTCGIVRFIEHATSISLYSPWVDADGMIRAYMHSESFPLVWAQIQDGDCSLSYGENQGLPYIQFWNDPKERPAP